MQVAIRIMENSKGVLIPKPILEQTGLVDVADLRVNNGVIEIRPLKRNLREGWAADSQRVAKSGEDAPVWPEFANAGDADLQWLSLQSGLSVTVWLVQLDPTVSGEIQKTRPCVLVSPPEMHNHFRTVIVAPMTTAARAAAFRIPVTFKGKTGLILLD